MESKNNQASLSWERISTFSRHLILVSVATISLLLVFDLNLGETHGLLRQAMFFQILSMLCGVLFSYLLSVTDSGRISKRGGWLGAVYLNLYTLQCSWFLFSMERLLTVVFSHL